MGATGSFPVDLVLFGMIAAFLVLRLRSVLGKRTGFERGAVPAARPDAPVIDARAEPPTPITPLRGVPDPTSAAGTVLQQMRQVDPGFDPARFLVGAETAFRMIVGAFAAGDRTTLRPLLGDETYTSFETAIGQREAAGETQRSEIRGIARAEIDEAVLRGTVGAVTVRFVSDQISLTLGRDGEPVHGTDAVTELTDMWTFERDLTSSDPTWRLTAARSA